MNKKKIALIGCGYWGQKIYNYLNKSEDFHLQYVFFRSLKDLGEEATKQKYGNEFVSSIDLILNDESVPNVIIATPVNTHYSLTKQALMKSKNVLVEKPLSTEPQQSNELIKIAEERKLILETEYTFTYSKALSHAQRMVEEGVIGEIESISLTRKQLGRFLDYDVYALLGTHCISILDMFLPINTCKFHPKPLMINNGLTTAAIIYFQSADEKCRGYIDVSLHCPVRETKVIICGKSGTIIYDPVATNTLTLTCYSRFQPKGKNKVAISTEKVYKSDENHNLERAIKHFSDIIEKEIPDNRIRASGITQIISAF